MIKPLKNMKTECFRRKKVSETLLIKPALSALNLWAIISSAYSIAAYSDATNRHEINFFLLKGNV